MYGMALMDRVRLDTLVTVVDCTTFLEHLRQAKVASEEDTPEMFFRSDEERDNKMEQEEEWMKDLPEGLREALGAGDKAPVSSHAGETGGVRRLYFLT